MEWVLDPTAWAGFATLVMLELILGIDNLVFIAILAQRLPPKQRDYARKVGLLLALGMRILLLFSISWMVSLTQPLGTVFGTVVTGRGLVLVLGGAFLLFKATHEIHYRIEGRAAHRAAGGYRPSLVMVITQIVVLDAVFSLDAVITAVGMVDDLSLMITAVTAAILIMIAVSKPLTDFVQKHPTVVMLCLGFLLMVGFSLVAEGLGADIPKGYLYAAIGFSVLIEAINQFAQAKLKKRVRKDTNVRLSAANAILKLMGAKSVESAEEVQEANAVLAEATSVGALTPTEKEMLRGVLALSSRQISTVMTPRRDVEFIDIKAPPQEIFERVKKSERSRILASDGELDKVVGILRKDEFLSDWLEGEHRHSLDHLLEEPLFVKDDTTVMALLEFLKKYPAGIAVVSGDKGNVVGVVTHIDLLEAIAGEFPSQDEPYTQPSIRENADGSWSIDGSASIYDLCNKMGVDYSPDGHFATVGGLVLHNLGHMPKKGDTLDWLGWRVEVRQMEGNRVARLRFTRLAEDAA
jgi:CBS domain containing-hemolysin-like protein